MTVVTVSGPSAAACVRAAPEEPTAGRYPGIGYQRHYQGLKARVIARPEGGPFDVAPFSRRPPRRCLPARR
jgi:hypothetical protein